MYSLWLTPEANQEFKLLKDLEVGYRSGRFSAGDLSTGVVLTVGTVQAGITRALQLDEPGSIRKLALFLSESVLRGLGVRGSEAHAIAAKVVGRVFGKRIEFARWEL